MRSKLIAASLALVSLGAGYGIGTTGGVAYDDYHAPVHAEIWQEGCRELAYTVGLDYDEANDQCGAAYWRM